MKLGHPSKFEDYINTSEDLDTLLLVVAGPNNQTKYPPTPKRVTNSLSVITPPQLAKFLMIQFMDKVLVKAVRGSCYGDGCVIKTNPVGFHWGKINILLYYSTDVTDSIGNYQIVR